MNESTAVLQSIHDRLRTETPEIVGEVSLSEEALSILDGKVRVSANVYKNPNDHPAVAHCHVIAELEARPDPLDVCIVGVNEQRTEALADAGRTWVELVAGPVLSLIHASPVLGAEHFDGTEQSGVSGCHGYLGPVGTRVLGEDFDLSPVLKHPLFDCVEAMTPPGIVHCAKVTLMATGSDGWRRSVEVDGHAASYSDSLTFGESAVPEQGILTRFAVFHFADQPEWAERRRQLDEAIQRYISAYESESPSDLLEAEGVPIELIHAIVNFVPLAFGRIALSGMDVTFSPNYLPIRPEGTVGDASPLVLEPVFARAIAIGATATETFEPIALSSPEVKVINNALHRSVEVGNLELSPPFVPDPGTTDEAIVRAINEWEQNEE